MLVPTDRNVLCVLETLICQLRNPLPHARKAIALGLAASRAQETNYLLIGGRAALGGASNMMQVIYIYCVTNLINNKKYVGQSRYLPEVRFNGHCSDANTRPERRGLAKAIRKYGKSSFIVEQLCSVGTQDEANTIERNLISRFDCLKNGYNMLIGGSGIRTVGNPHTKTDKWKAKMSEIRKNSWKDPICRAKMTAGRWADYVKKIHYLPPTLTIQERADVISKSNKARAKTYSFLSPDNKLLVVNDLVNFCKENNLDSSCMSRVSNSIYQHHKQWKKAIFQLIKPQGMGLLR